VCLHRKLVGERDYHELQKNKPLRRRKHGTKTLAMMKKITIPVMVSEMAATLLTAPTPVR